MRSSRVLCSGPSGVEPGPSIDDPDEIADGPHMFERGDGKVRTHAVDCFDAKSDQNDVQQIELEFFERLHVVDSVFSRRDTPAIK